MRLLVSLLALFALHSTVAETPGVCSVSRVVEKNRYVMDRSIKAWRYEKYNETINEKECCSGYRYEKLKPLSCAPICDPECENSDCMAPDTCVCHPGHIMINNSTSSCYDLCDSCVNGACSDVSQTECICYNGYQRDPTFQHICDPICSPDCVYGSCTAPSVCECYDGYKPNPNPTLHNICIPHCTEDCIYGFCSEPDVCKCLEGYINDKDSPSICLPVCNQTCENGDCYAPDMCKCRDGFELHPRNPYNCIPQAPEDSLLNYCDLKMPQAVKYDRDSDCFLIKERITLGVPSDCRVIQSHPGSLCSRPDTCHLSECVLNFRCVATKIRGTNEIHCYLEEEDFATDSPDIDHITNSTDWTDVVLVVNSFQSFNSSVEVKDNVTKEWVLQPISKRPVCGKMYFAVEVNECEMPTIASPVYNHINSSFMFWMNAILITGFLLLVAAGAGGFLWARHRRLNNPLNYREDMNQGYYNNQCYENHPVVSDDDSDQYSDAPL